MIKKPARIAKQMMNVEDWLPTLYTIAGFFQAHIIDELKENRLYYLFFCAGGSSSDLPLLDGMDMWKALSQDLDSPRNLMLHNIDESRNIAAVRVGNWKLVKGQTFSRQTLDSGSAIL